MSLPVPRCPYPEEHVLSNPQEVILKETDTDWVFGCLTCKGRWVVSKPAVVEQARYEQEMKARARRATERERKQFALGGF